MQRNLAVLRKKIGSSLFCLPVKANAYGHGLVEVARFAQKMRVDCLGVSCLREGIALREANIQIPILVFGAIHEEQIAGMIEYELQCSISSRYKAELVAKMCASLQKKCRIHLEIDTGIQRTGVRPTTALGLFEFVSQCPYFHLVGIYSHLATADLPEDLYAEKQIALFSALKGQIKGECLWHLANSGGTLFYPHSHFDMVRPGLISYGYFPNGETGSEIAPCLSLKSRVSYFKVVEAGRGISYGHHYRTSRQTRIVTVPIGYGDGYRRAFFNRAPVLIRGRRYAVAGAICMDQFMVDVGEDEVYVGDEVTLIGKQGNEEVSLWELAHLADTIPYEILCGFNERLPRISV